MPVGSWTNILSCPLDGAPLRAQGGVLSCRDHHAYPVVGSIARLLPPDAVQGRDALWQRFYDLAAPLYDLNERLGSRLLLGLDMQAERAALVRRLNLAPGTRLLEVSPGPGVYQGLLAAAVGASGELAEVDLSLGMLRACAHRARRSHLAPLLVQANAARLPFTDSSFDAVFHFGGVKLFSDPAQALREMVRVARPGAIVAWGDEGFGSSVARGWRTRVLERINPGFAEPQPPVPAGLRVEAQHEVIGGYAWLTVARKV